MSTNNLQPQISTLENMIPIQKDFVIAGRVEADYMHGMLNGLLCAKSVLTNISPEYHSMPKYRRSTQVRHKVVRGPKVKNK